MRSTTQVRFASFALLSAALSLSSFAQVQPAAKPAAPPASPAPALAGVKGLQTAAVTPTPAPATPKKPGAEGLTMHGHWTIDLINADGTIAEHRDFENSLIGPTMLYQIITGQYVEGDLGITIASSGSYVCTTFDAGTSGGLGNCLVGASSTAGLGGFTCAFVAAGFCNYTLKEVVNVGGGNGAITLSGTMPVLANGSVTAVGTQVMVCNSGGTGTYSTIDSVGCYNQTEGGGWGYGNLTGTSITPLVATVGQTLAFTVVLSFS